MTCEALVQQIKAALGNLAMSAAKQIAYVRERDVGTDELALEFDDVSATRRTLLADGNISQQQADAIGAVEHQLTSITRAGPIRWTTAAIEGGDDWKRVRELAELALRALS
jgi:hypothetical protein